VQLRRGVPGRSEALVAVSSSAFNDDMDSDVSRKEPEPSFADLMTAVAVGRDRVAFAKLFGYFAPRIKAYVRCLGVADHKAEDVVQEVMLTVWHRASLYDAAQASVGTWIFTIARNKRIDEFRRERRPQIDLEDPMLVRDPEPTADETWLQAQAERRLKRAVQALPEEQALVLRKNFFEDKPHGVIAEELNLPLGTVKSRARLALAKLREALRDLD
jgi:RNA polymerase sigma-70 factor (ECF subfamily)